MANLDGVRNNNVTISRGLGRAALRAYIRLDGRVVASETVELASLAVKSVVAGVDFKCAARVRVISWTRNFPGIDALGGV